MVKYIFSILFLTASLAFGSGGGPIPGPSAAPVSPGGNTNDIQTNDGSGGFAGSDSLSWDGSVFTADGRVLINGVTDDTTTPLQVNGDMSLTANGGVVPSTVPQLTFSIANGDPTSAGYFYIFNDIGNQFGGGLFGSDTIYGTNDTAVFSANPTGGLSFFSFPGTGSAGPVTFGISSNGSPPTTPSIEIEPTAGHVLINSTTDNGSGAALQINGATTLDSNSVRTNGSGTFEFSNGGGYSNLGQFYYAIPDGVNPAFYYVAPNTTNSMSLVIGTETTYALFGQYDINSSINAGLTFFQHVPGYALAIQELGGGPGSLEVGNIVDDSGFFLNSIDPNNRLLYASDGSTVNAYFGDANKIYLNGSTTDDGTGLNIQGRSLSIDGGELTVDEGGDLIAQNLFVEGNTGSSLDNGFITTNGYGTLTAQNLSVEGNTGSSLDNGLITTDGYGTLTIEYGAINSYSGSLDFADSGGMYISNGGGGINAGNGAPQLNIDGFSFSPSAGWVLAYNATGSSEGSAAYVPTDPTTLPSAVMTSNATGTATFNSNGQTETIYDSSSSTVASLTITLPTVSQLGQILRYVTAAVVTSVTVSGTVSIGAPITTLAANSSVAWQAVDTSGTFIRIQ